MILLATWSNNAIQVSQGDLKDCRAKTPSARFLSSHDWSDRWLFNLEYFGNEINVYI